VALLSLVAVVAPLVDVVSAPPADAASGWKLPWAAGDRWIVARGPIGHSGDPGIFGNGLYWDIVPYPGESYTVVAATDGTARIVCGPDAIGQVAIMITTSSGLSTVYAHLSGSAVAAAGITTGGKAVEQGDVVGSIYPAAGSFAGTCGSGSGAHLHFELSAQPVTIDGITFSNTGPETGILTSSNSGAPDAPSGAQLTTEPDGTLWMSAGDVTNALYTRMGEPTTGWQERVRQGSGWISADLAVAEDGSVWLVGVKEDGHAFARRYSGGWGGWTELGSGAWSTVAPPSVTPRADGGITVAMVKANGTLYTRNWTPREGWSAFSVQGSGSWAMADIATAEDGDLWLLAVKRDGRAYIRRGVPGSGWNAFSSQGGGFDADVPPAITHRPGNGITWAMVSSAGSLYTRNWSSGAWSTMMLHGSGNWATVDITLDEDDALWLAAVKRNGDAHTRRGIIGSGWNGFTEQGSGGWSREAPPGITPRDGGGITFSMLKTSGTLYTRNWTPGTGWWDFLMHYGAGTWAS
jgi:hypothetical protein